MQSKTKKLLTMFFVVGVLLLAMTACGGGQTDTSSIQPTPTQQPNEPQTQTENSNSDTIIGDVIEFAGFEWRILDVQDGNTFIISENIFINSFFNATNENLSWEESHVRQYLNDEFYNSLSESDRNRIVETLLTNRLHTFEEDERQYDSETLDRIFLLSSDEVNEFMSGHNSVRRVWHIETGSLENWWLRTVTPTMLDGRQQVLRVNGNGSTVTSNVNGPGSDNVGVRPAMWIRL